jgi:hypothetical protein
MTDGQSQAGDHLRAAAGHLVQAQLELRAAHGAASDDEIRGLAANYVATVDGLGTDFRDLAELADREAKR